MLTTKKIPTTVLPVFAAALVLLVSGCTPSGPEALEQGEKLIREGRYEAAVKKLRIAVEKLPNSPQAYNFFGLAYHKMGDFKQAETRYARALEIDRNHAPVYYNLANLQLQQTNYPGAIRTLQTFVALQPESPQGWTALGAAQKKIGQLDAAAQSYMHASNLSPDRPDIFNELGMIQLAQNQPAIAKGFFERAVTTDTNYAPAVLNLAIVSHRHQTNFPAAIAYYRRYLALDPDSPNADAIGRAVGQLTSALEAPKPEPIRTNAVAKVEPKVVTPAPEPEPVKVTLPMGDTQFVALKTETSSTPQVVRELLERGRLSESMVLTARLQPVEIPAPELPEPKPFGIRTNLDLSFIEPELPAETPVVETAPPVLVAATPQNGIPAEVTPLDGLGEGASPSRVAAPEPEPKPKRGFWQKVNPVNWFGSDDEPEVAEQPAAATSVAARPVASPPPARAEATVGNKPVLTPDDPSEPRRPVAIAPPPVVEKAPEYPRYTYQKYPVPTPGNVGQAKTFILRGVTEQKRKQYVDAIANYRTALRWDPASFDAWYNIGVSAYHGGLTSTALEAFEHALGIDPTSFKARYNFALVLREAGYPIDSAAELSLLEERYPDDVRVQLALGNLHAQALLKYDVARRYYRKVLELAPSHPQSTQIRYWLELHPGP